MRKPASQKRQALKALRFAICQSRKIGRQINRKLESLATLNKIKAAAQKRLIDLCGLR